MMRRLAGALVVVAFAGCTSGTGGPSGSALGGPCAADKDCQAGLFCKADDPGGQCEKSCTSTADCGNGNTCALDQGQLKCYPACRTAADCPRPGYGCVGQDPRNPTNTFCDNSSGDDGGDDGSSSHDGSSSDSPSGG